MFTFSPMASVDSKRSSLALMSPSVAGGLLGQHRKRVSVPPSPSVRRSRIDENDAPHQFFADSSPLRTSTSRGRTSASPIRGSGGRTSSSPSRRSASPSRSSMKKADLGDEVTGSRRVEFFVRGGAFGGHDLAINDFGPLETQEILLFTITSLLRTLALDSARVIQ